MRLSSFFAAFFLLCHGPFAQNALPSIAAFDVTVNATQQCTVSYSVSDPDNNALEVSLQFSNDGGKTYNVQAANVLGDVGFPITPGNGKLITCDLSGVSMGNLCMARLVVDDRMPFDIASIVAEIDSQRLLQDLRFVQGIRHRTAGAAHLSATRDSMVRLFEKLKLHTNLHNFPFGSYTGRNVLGQQTGLSDPNKTVIIDAHYDSVNDAPGADDNGSGTVGVWEAARILSRFPSKKTLRYIGFDLEEAGLVGSKKYVESQIPATETIVGLFNLEMIGYYSEMPNSQELPTGFDILFPGATAQLQLDSFRGNFLTNVANTPSQSLELKVTTLVIPGNGAIAPDLSRSDHAFFWSTGRPAIMLTDGAEFRNECYHTPEDSINKLNFTFMSQVVKATVAAAADLAEMIHGDWATQEIFCPMSATNQAQNNCDLKMSYDQGQLRITTGECHLKNAQLRVIDENGRLVYNSSLEMQPQAPRQVPLFLPNGIYFSQLMYEGGSSSEKIVVFK
jgi:Peptidase family M28